MDHVFYDGNVQVNDDMGVGGVVESGWTLNVHESANGSIRVPGNLTLTGAGNDFTVTGSVLIGTGTQKGDGTLNVRNGIYQNGGLIHDYVLEAYNHNEINYEKLDKRVRAYEREVKKEYFDNLKERKRTLKSRKQSVGNIDGIKAIDSEIADLDKDMELYKTDEEMESLIHTPAKRFDIELNLDLDKYAAYFKEHEKLPSMPLEESTEREIGDFMGRLLETVEVQAVHIDKLNQRLKALEATQ